MDYNILPLKKESIFEVASIEKSCFSKPWSIKNLTEEIESSYTISFLISSEEKIVGYFIAKRILDEAELLRIAILPEKQGHGFASALMAYYHNLLDASVQSFLEVDEGNTSAICLYRRFGYEVYNVRRDYYGKGEHALLMKREIL